MWQLQPGVLSRAAIDAGVSGPLSISGTPVTTGTEDAAYAGFTVVASGGTAPYTYSVASGALPSGITLNSSSGLVSGTPTTVGTYASIVIRVTDNVSATADLASFTITIIPAAAADWTLVNSWVYSTNVAQVDFTGLAGYTEVRVLVRGLNGALAIRQLFVSTNNGSSFLTTSGDYIIVSSDGVESNNTHVAFAGNTGAISSEIIIAGWNLTAIKLAQNRTSITTRTYLIPTASPLNALRVQPFSGSITGGSIYVFAR